MAFSAEESLEWLVRLRGCAAGRPVLASWQSTVWALRPGHKPEPLFRLDGFSASRFEADGDGGWRMLSRELAAYRDLQTGERLLGWDNPFSGQRNTVQPVRNDPVNFAFPAPGRPGHRPLNLREQGGQLLLQQDVPLAYPNPLPPAQFPEASSGPLYIGSEHFLFEAPPLAQDCLPMRLQWTRTGPWLPWMQLGTAPGQLLYIGHGRKLGSAAELDPLLHDWAAQEHPAFLEPPTTWQQPNQSSWTQYRDTAWPR